MDVESPPPENSGSKPSQLGRFEVVRPLGKGGMGSVFLARDPALERQVAVKVLAGPSSEDGRQRLLREARALAQLNHPHVVHVYEVGIVGEQVFLAMEFVDGPTLRTWSQTPRSWSELMQVFLAAGQGLAAAHAAGIVHRDFKPDNVIVGLDGRVRVLDFGLARGVQQSADPKVFADAPTRKTGPEDLMPSALRADGRLTRTGAVVGTPAFMSPEQHDGRPVDARSDQFSFAVVLWLTLYGERPFAGETLVQIAFSTVLGRVKAPRLGHGHPPEAEAVLRRALSARPDDRFESMTALLARLSAIEPAEGGQRETSTAADRPDPVAERSSVGAVVGRRYEAFEPAPLPGTFRAMDRLAGGTVTLIALPPAGTQAAMAQRLRRIASFRHPNLARILDFGVDERGEPFLVEEPLESSEDLVFYARGASPSVQVRLLSQLIRGLEYLHHQQLVHGRVSRASVRVLNGRVKISDFARAVFSDEPSPPEADLEGAAELAEAIGLCVPSGAPLASIFEPRGGATAALARLAETFGPDVRAERFARSERSLQSVPLVGRGAQVASLEAHLDRAVSGHGGLVLIAGDSGVGKSRLVEELRALALARGAVLIHGQADAEQRYPYCIWSKVLRWLALLGCPDVMTAGVLASYVSDIERLVGRAVSQAPALDSESQQSRLTRAVLACFEQIEAPMVILLEDIHWMRPESARLLAEVTPKLEGRRVLIVGSFSGDLRTDWGIPDSAELLRLEGLDEASIGALCTAAVGAEKRSLAEALLRETEGNPFLVLQMLRELGEEFGGFEAVRVSDRTPRVPSGGARRVLSHRLAQVQEWARPLLELAAVAGRDLDLGLLEDLAQTELAEDWTLADWLEHGAGAAVLESEPRWRFAHDKLRDHLLESLPLERARARAAQVAAAVERRAAGNVDVAMLLARLYRSAQDVAKEAHFAGLAGARALEIGSSEEAVGFLERALESSAQGHPLADRARLHRLLGEARYLTGDRQGAVEALERAIAAVARPLPRNPVQLALRAALELAQLLTGWYSRKGRVQAAALRDASLAAARVAHLTALTGDSLRGLTASITSANLASRAGFTSASGLGVIGSSAAYLGAHSTAERLFARARAGAVAEGDFHGLIEVTQMQCVLLAGTGAFEQAFLLIDAGQRVSEQAGFQLGVDLSVALSSTLHALTGDLGRWEEGILASKRNLRTPEHLHRVLCQEVHLRVFIGQLDEAARLVESEIPSVPSADPLADLLAASAGARLAAVRGDPALAARAAESKFALAVEVPPTAAPFVYGGLADALSAALPEHPFAARSATRLVARMATVARRFPTLVPETERLRAALASHRRDRAEAERALKRAAASAERIGRRLELGLALRSLANLGGPNADAHRSRADALLLEAGYGRERSTAAWTARVMSDPS